MESEDNKYPKNQSKGYGKRSMGQWILIYLVVGVIVYGLVYYFLLRDSGGGGFSY